MSNHHAPSNRLAGFLAFAFIVVFAAAMVWSGTIRAQEQTGTPHLMLELEDGTVDIELLPELAPNHVERIVTLTGEDFYDGVVFHRVIPGFMAQTGDPTGTGAGGSELPDLEAEFTDAPFERGTVAAARTMDPNSANSQFFIVYDAANAGHLADQYTVFGRVVAGMEHVEGLEMGTSANNGVVANPDSIIDAEIEYRD